MGLKLPRIGLNWKKKKENKKQPTVFRVRVYSAHDLAHLAASVVVNVCVTHVVLLCLLSDLSLKGLLCEGHYRICKPQYRKGLLRTWKLQLVRNPPAMQETWVGFPRSGRSSGEGHGNPLQCSCLEDPQGQRSLVGCSPLGHKESDSAERLSTANLLSSFSA